MTIKIWSGGLTAHEVEVIKKIEQNFCAEISAESKLTKSTKITNFKELSQLKSNQIPLCQGYAGFRFVDKTGYEGEFDLVLVTHCNVLIIELKHWNGEITYSDDKWYQNGEDRGRSPVSITRNKKYLLENRLNEYKKRFTNKGYRPNVYFFIVMTGNADFSQLPDSEKEHIITLKDFLSFNDKIIFNNKFRPHPNSQVLNKDFLIFDELFGEDKVKPKSFRIGGYVVEEDADFTHPNAIYQEFVAKSENIKHQETDQALVRRWDFNQLNQLNYHHANTPEGRYRLISREYEVLQEVKIADEELYGDFLNHKRPPSQTGITSDYVELFGILPSNKRFNIFIEQHAKQFKLSERLGLAHILLDKFARLHKVNIAHRDLGQHSIWISTGRKITLSGLICAYFPKEGTVGDVRELLSVSKNSDLLSDDFPVENLTAFEHDVRSLAVLSWHLIQGKSLSPDSLKTFSQELIQSNEWYDKIFEQALSSSFKNAIEFLQAFKDEKPEQAVDFSFDYRKLETYKHNISHSRQYRDDKFIIENDDKEVYISNGQLVKAWLNIQYENNEIMAHYLYRFLEKVAQLKNLKPDYLPTIQEFGIAQKSASLYMVSDFIEGISWSQLNNLNLTQEQKYEAIQKLIHAIEHLHGLGFAHGDLHPENIKLTLNEDEECHLYLLDILDFTPNGKSNLNYQYAPSTAENSSEYVRDNFAVMKMSCELLGIQWGEFDDEFFQLSEVIDLELKDDKSGFISLDRFKNALTPIQKINFIEVKGRGDEIIKIYPDNSELFVQLEPSLKDKNKIRVRFMGIGGTLDAICNPKNTKLEQVFKPREKDDISYKDKENSTLILPFGLEIFGERSFDLMPLNTELENYPDFTKAVSAIFAQVQEESHKNNQEINQTDNENVTQANQTIDETDFHLPEKRFERPNSYDLWTAILRTEIESLPFVRVVRDLKLQENNIRIYVPKITQSNDKYYIHCEFDDENEQLLDRFRSDELVDIIARDVLKDRDIKIGRLNIKDSHKTRLCLDKEPKNAWVLRDNPIIYLQSKQNEISFRRRKNALKRILSNEGIIDNLPDYFDDSCSLPAKNYPIAVSNEDFARYNTDKVSLNQAQREAFVRLLQNGPVSLLQGPPGTGKTEFISAFVHFLFEKQNVKNILLVSQSHEAVNTASERIRRHCQRLGTPLELVRFSNRESAVSNELQDAFSQNIISAKRELLQATQLERIVKLGQSFGISENYLKQLAELQLGIGLQIKRHQRLSADYSMPSDNDKKAHKKLCQDLEGNIRQSIIDKIDNPNKIDLAQIMPILVENLNKQFAIAPKQAKQANQLIDLTIDMQKALSNERVGYDEFLARSRQLVVGTCVGIGQSHIGIADNTYDWVIIDEAARSVSSELAIAMQSGKRILLVGDHKQLPPLYHEEHKNALARRLGITERGEDLDYVLGSDFERVFDSKYGKQVCATLQTQYRMAPAIGSLVSKCFYQGQLENGRPNEKVSDIYFKLPEKFHSTVTWLDTSKLANTYHIQNDNGSLKNETEAELIIELLQELANNDEFCHSEIAKECLQKGEVMIGVICMYGEQKQLIRKKFNQKSWSEHFKALVKIDTVDSYQGKENRMIILSITRHDKERSVGFLRLPNRINVALSRAMDRLIIVGATRMWQNTNDHYPFGKVLTMIKENSNSNEYCILPAKS